MIKVKIKILKIIIFLNIVKVTDTVKTFLQK